MLMSLAVAAVALCMVGITVGAAGTGQSGSQVGQENERGVLHIKGTKQGPQVHEMIEAWLDLATHEGMILQSSADGQLRRALLVAGDTYTQYLADANHVLVRQGFSNSSPFATRVRDELLTYRVAADHGTAERIGSGFVQGRVTDRIRRTLGASESNGFPIVVADVDRETGLVLREEAIMDEGGPPVVTETTYSVIELIDRSALPMDILQLRVPADASREEYVEDGPSAAPSRPAYAVYAVPASEGSPVAQFRRTSTTPGAGPNGGAEELLAIVHQGDRGGTPAGDD